MPRWSRCAVALLALVAACGDDAETAEPPASASEAAAGGAPWEGIPPDSLYGATAAENIRLTRVALDVARLPDGWEGTRIAAISDLRLGLWEDNEAVAAAAVRRALAANPDVIVLLGDYVESQADTAALARVLAPLQGRQVLAVLGDRDVSSDSLEAAVVRTLSAQGVRVLNNESITLSRGESPGTISGVDPELATEPWGDQEWVLATLGGEAAPVLLLSHIPQLAARMPEGKFPAVLGGNTVCAPVDVPNTPRLSWLREQALPGAAVAEVERLFRVEGATLFVTCGVGYSFVPVRFGSPPEVALITLHGPEAPAPAEAGADSAAVDTLLQRYQRADTAAADGTGG